MAETLQTIAIDDDHLQMQRADGKPAPSYEMQAAPSIALDAAGYVFHNPAALEGRRPNSIQLVLGKDRKYSARWNQGQTRHVLVRDSLQPIAGSPEFDGFPAGITGIIAIGCLDGSSFSVLWVGMFRVE